MGGRRDYEVKAFLPSGKIATVKTGYPVHRAAFNSALDRENRLRMCYGIVPFVGVTPTRSWLKTTRKKFL